MSQRAAAQIICAWLSDITGPASRMSILLG